MPTVANVLNNVLNSKPESVLNHCVKPNLVSLIGILSHSPPQAPLRGPVKAFAVFYSCVKLRARICVILLC
jgi:hypothetical protein